MGIFNQRSRLGVRNCAVNVIAGAAGKESRASAQSGVAALALMQRIDGPIRLICCASHLPDMEVQSFLRRCAELHPQAYRALVLERGIECGDPARRFHAHTVVPAPLTSAAVCMLLAAARESRWIRVENHRLHAELDRAEARACALRVEQSQLLRFLGEGVRRVRSVHELMGWWHGISRYLDTEAADIPVFARETELFALVDDVIDDLSRDTHACIHNHVSRSQCASVDRVSFMECLRFALRGLAAAAPGGITVRGSVAELTLFHARWDLSLTELDQVLEPYARTVDGALENMLDLPLARLLARKQGLALDARPGPRCRGVRLVIALPTPTARAECRAEAL